MCIEGEMSAVEGGDAFAVRYAIELDAWASEPITYYRPAPAPSS
jgi:hypothetical protein